MCVPGVPRLMRVKGEGVVLRACGVVVAGVGARVEAEEAGGMGEVAESDVAGSVVEAEEAGDEK